MVPVSCAAAGRAAARVIMRRPRSITRCRMVDMNVTPAATMTETKTDAVILSFTVKVKAL